MAHKSALRRYRNWYAKLLRFYPTSYRRRFGEGMEQTFADLCRERVEAGRGLLAFTLWIFFETSSAILKENGKLMMVRYKRIVRIALVTALILLVPLLAMQFTDEVVWNLADFVVGGALLFGTGLAYELIARKWGNTAYRAAVGVAVAAALILIWINLAVGLIGDEENPANLMYIGVLAIGVIGAFISHLRPRGMSRAMVATALAQMSVGVIVLIAGLGFTLIVDGAFAALFFGSALLFREAAREQDSTGAAPTG